VVAGAEGLLLHDRWSGVRDHSFATEATNNSAHTVSHAASNSATYAAPDAASDSAFAAANSATCTSRTRRSLQLRRRTVFCLGPKQAVLVLPASSYLWSADATAGTSGSLQLCGWLRELAGWLVSSQEDVVLSGSWERLPEPGWRVHDFLRAVRLRCWICQLDGGLVSPEEGLVLLEQGQGLPASSWRMCLIEICHDVILPGSGAGAGHHLLATLSGALKEHEHEQHGSSAGKSAACWSVSRRAWC